MVTLEQVEKLREYANISYEDAKAALESTDGDLLEALVQLERQGKVTPPSGGGQYHCGQTTSLKTDDAEQNSETDHTSNNEQARCHERSAFKKHCHEFFEWIRSMIHKGNINSFLVEKEGEFILKLPLTVMILCLIFAFWLVVPFLVIGLFFHFRYSIQGPDIKTTKVNDAMNTVANAAEEIKNDMKHQ